MCSQVVLQQPTGSVSSWQGGRFANLIDGGGLVIQMVIRGKHSNGEQGGILGRKAG
jgi:hypothetical protein